MEEFKGTKGEWEVCEHNWSDTSILCGNKTIATMSIYDEATEETQEALENEVLLNFRLMSMSKHLLELLVEYVSLTSKLEIPQHLVETYGNLEMNAESIINKALGK